MSVAEALGPVPHYIDPTLIAVPFFVATLLWEIRVTRIRRDAGKDVLGYRKVDTWISLGMGAGSLVTVGLLNLAIFALASLLWHVRPFDLGNTWQAWIVALFAWDFVYYWTHRWEHTVRLFWAAHVNHHSSANYNLSTALRQPWTPVIDLATFPLLALLGVRPWIIMVSGGLNLIYQYWIHTEAIDRLPAWFERVLNTPSHHRVHHGSNPQYIDKNYGGILIIWDRMFRTFEPERERVRYGLTEPFDTHNLLVAVLPRVPGPAPRRRPRPHLVGPPRLPRPRPEVEAHPEAHPGRFTRLTRAQVLRARIVVERPVLHAKSRVASSSCSSAGCTATDPARKTWGIGQAWPGAGRPPASLEAGHARARERGGQRVPAGGVVA